MEAVDGARRDGHEDRAGDGNPGAERDGGREVRAHAVPEHEHPRRVDLWHGRGLTDGRARVVDDLLVVGDLPREAPRVLVRPLVVAEDGDPAGGQAPGEILEEPAPAVCLVAVARAGSGPEDHGGKGPAPNRKRQRRAELGEPTYLESALGERMRVGIGWRAPKDHRVARGKQAEKRDQGGAARRALGPELHGAPRVRRAPRACAAARSLR